MNNIFKKILAFLVIAFLINLSYYLCHKCIHDKLNFKPKINEAMEKKDLRFLQPVDWTPIKIHIDYTYLNSQTSVDAKTVEFTKKVIDDAIKIFTNILSVKKVNPILKINECDDIPKAYIDNNLKTAGVDADIVIFPYFDLKAEERTEAYAAACVSDPK